jgi:hypothetical protein
MLSYCSRVAFHLAIVLLKIKRSNISWWSIFVKKGFVFSEGLEKGDIDNAC